MSVLLIPLALVLVGVLVAGIRSRQNSGIDADVETFRRELDALAPSQPPGRHIGKRS